MTDDLEELKRRLVVGHKSDGRSVYDEAVKAELVALCMQPGASVSQLARECGVNSNQVSRWLREHGQIRRRKGVATASPATPMFVAVPVVVVAPATSAGHEDSAAFDRELREGALPHLDQESMGPIGVSDQSIDRTSLPISPPPTTQWVPACSRAGCIVNGPSSRDAERRDGGAILR
jgi:transposase